MVCSFLVNGIVFSIINTFGILFVKVRESWPPSAVFWKKFQLKEELKEAGDEDAAFKTCNVFFFIKTKLSSLYLFVWRMGLFFCVGAFFLLSYCWVSRNWLRLPHFLFLGHSFRQVSCSLFFSCSFSNPLLRRIGLRATSVLGGLIATIGLGLSSLVFKVIIIIITIRALPSSSSSSEDWMAVPHIWASLWCRSLPRLQPLPHCARALLQGDRHPRRWLVYQHQHLDPQPLP